MSDTLMFFAVWLGVDKRLQFLEFSELCQKPQTHNSGEKNRVWVYFLLTYVLADTDNISTRRSVASKERIFK